MTHSELETAVRTGDLAAVRIGCELGLDADDDNTPNGWKGRLLEIAAKPGHVDVAEYLISRGAHPDIVGESYMMEGYSYDGAPLIQAAENGHPDMVDLLLKHGAQVNRSNKQGYTAFTKAVDKYLRERNTDADTLRYNRVIDKLIPAGADMNTVNWEGDPYLLEMINCYLGQDPNRMSMMVHRMIQNGAEVNVTNAIHRLTPLHVAAMTKQLDIAKVLLSHGANVKAVTVGGESAMDLALRVNDVDMVEILANASGTSLAKIAQNIAVDRIIAGEESGNANVSSGQKASSDKKSGPCFVATACYGDFDHPDVVTFRKWRDSSLLPTSMGRAFVEIYYRVSPPAAERIAKMPRLASLIRRRILEPVARRLR